MKLCKDCKSFRENVHSDTTCRRAVKETTEPVTGVVVVVGAKSAHDERASWLLPFRCSPLGIYWEQK